VSDRRKDTTEERDARRGRELKNLALNGKISLRDLASTENLHAAIYKDDVRVGRELRIRELGPPKKRGPKPKTKMFIQAKRLHGSQNLSWTKIAKRLTPKAYAADPRKASEAIRQGVLRLNSKNPTK
jgi:hypothetical protein